MNLLAAGASLPSEAPFGRWNELRKGVKDLGYDLRLLGGNRPRPIEALTKRLSELRQKLGDVPISRCSWRSAPITLCRNSRMGRPRKSNRLPSPAIAAGRASARRESPGSQTRSIRRFCSRSLGIVALASQEQMSISHGETALNWVHRPQHDAFNLRSGALSSRISSPTALTRAQGEAAGTRGVHRLRKM